MLIWIIALLLFISLGIIGYYQGALRGAVTFVGLIAAMALAVPLGGAFKWVLNIFGVEHPVLLAFLGPLMTYGIVLICFKAGAMATHKKVDTYFKYKASDTLRLLYDRMNSRVGIAVGVMNAFLYVIIVGVVVYMMGYFTLQVRTSDKDSFVVRTMARLAEDLRETKLDLAVAAFIPKADLYFDGCDVVATIFQNHLLQNRLSTYPPFLTLNEKPDFKQMATRTEFQDFWIKGPSIQEFRSHELVKPVVESGEMYENLLAIQGGDLKDLKTYLETGKSLKYDDELILGRWDFDGGASFALARKNKPNMTLQQQRQLRAVLGAGFKDAMLTATVDKKVFLKAPEISKLQVVLPQAKPSYTGEWEPGQSAGYVITLSPDSSPIKVEVLVIGRRMTLSLPASLLGLKLVFDKQ